MPAVQLARLKGQIDNLLVRFELPAEFQRGLHDLLEFYSDHTYRVGQGVPAAPLIPSFHAPPLVLKQLARAAELRCERQPQAALALIDCLWADPYLEPRLLSADLLGMLPAEVEAETIARLKAWCVPATERVLTHALIRQGTARMRVEGPGQYLAMVKDWGESIEPALQSIALRALLPLVEDLEFENLPGIFGLLPRIMAGNPSAVQNELQELLVALARRSPGETGYFLRQVLSIEINPILHRIGRRCLPLLTPTGQASLRSVLSDRSR